LSVPDNACHILEEMLMKRPLWILLCTAPLLAHAADTPDKSFYKSLAEGGLAEVSDGTLASEKATDPKLKDFGAMMVKDHSAANDKLSALAATKSLTLPTSASVTQMAEHEKLKLLSGETFDQSYIKGQISAHRSTIKLLRKEISAGQDADAQSFAKDVLPTVQSHLKAIDALATAEGVSTK
jgi:putative membrane protein